jgi:hypothetical protein
MWSRDRPSRFDRVSAGRDLPVPRALTYKVSFYVDELNKVTLSGLQKMVRMGDWKLVFDIRGYGQLYNLAADPCELTKLPHCDVPKLPVTADMAGTTDSSRLALCCRPLNGRNRVCERRAMAFWFGSRRLDKRTDAPATCQPI